MPLNIHYLAVLEDLKEDRDRLAKSLSEVNAAIRIIEKRSHLSSSDKDHQGEVASLANQAPIAAQNYAQRDNLLPPDSNDYADMSMRWAILHILGDAECALPTPDISAFLQRGGAQSKGKNFNSNVSAVISDMCRKRKELDAVEDGYRINELGKAVLARIKAIRESRNQNVNMSIPGVAAD